MCKEVLVLSIYKKTSRKVCSITKSLRSQTKVWKLETLGENLKFYLIFDSGCSEETKEARWGRGSSGDQGRWGRRCFRFGSGSTSNRKCCFHCIRDAKRRKYSVRERCVRQFVKQIKNFESKSKCRRLKLKQLTAKIQKHHLNCSINRLLEVNAPCVRFPYFLFAPVK